MSLWKLAKPGCLASKMGSRMGKDRKPCSVCSPSSEPVFLGRGFKVLCSSSKELGRVCDDM